jgi:hypothetical protein
MNKVKLILPAILASISLISPTVMAGQFSLVKKPTATSSSKVADDETFNDSVRKISDEGDHFKIAFNNQDSFYTVAKKSPHASEFIDILKESEREQTFVTVRSGILSATIKDVKFTKPQSN